MLGFDNTGFVMGTSSTLFNQIILGLKNITSLPDFLQNAINGIVADIGRANEDIADYPNPFLGFNNATNPNANTSVLHLVDGGEDLQNLPLQPLIQPSRNVDVIFAIDSSADTTTTWPNATALVATYERSLPGSNIANGTGFPSIPDQNTIVNLGLNTRPTFFGCNSSNFTDGLNAIPPLVVYIANAPYVTYSNATTATLKYNSTFRDDIILNGQDVVTMGNGTLDPQWPACVGLCNLESIV